MLNTPSGPLASGFSESGAALLKKTLGLDGQNFKYAETTGDDLTLPLGKRASGLDAFNGLKVRPDMTALRGLSIVCRSTAGDAPDWTAAGTTALTAVTVATSDVFTKAGHGLVTGQRVIPSGFTGAAGVTMGTAYFVIREDANTFKLATSKALAIAGTAVNVTTLGTGGTITPAPLSSLTFGFLSDCGDPGAAQTAAAAAVQAWNPEAIFLAGDFSYNMEADGAAGLEADTDVFLADITAERLYVVNGNHEWDRETANSDLLALLIDRFPYLSAFDEGGTPSQHYDVTFKADEGDAAPLVHFLLLDPALDSTGAFQYPSGGAELTEATGLAYVEARLAAVPVARYRVAVLHYPAVSSVAQNGQSDNGVLPQLTFLARSGLFDLIICGHTHSTEVIHHHGVPVLNVSSSVQDVREAGAALSGATAEASLVYSHSTARTVGKLTATPDALAWEIHQVGGAVLNTGRALPRAVPFGAFNVEFHGFSQTAGTGTSAVAVQKFAAGDALNAVWRNAQPLHAGEAITGASIEAATDLVTAVGHGLRTGARVNLAAITGGAGLGVGEDYYWIYVSSTTGKLAISMANAFAGTGENVTTNATGVTLVPFVGIVATRRDVEAVDPADNVRNTKLEIIAAGL